MRVAGRRNTLSAVGHDGADRIGTFDQPRDDAGSENTRRGTECHRARRESSRSRRPELSFTPSHDRAEPDRDDAEGWTRDAEQRDDESYGAEPRARSVAKGSDRRVRTRR